MITSTAPLRISPRLLERFGTVGPRYTSYPTADRFGPGFGAGQYRAALERRVENAREPGATPAPLSVYVHIPFCESICYYCACNKVITRHHERAGRYFDALEAEIDLHARALGEPADVSQLHFGGGTPTFLSDEELSRLMRKLRSAFRIAPGTEASIEVDPRTVTGQRLAHLSSLGFNRLSLGVQDFDPAVQLAVNRIQPHEDVAKLMAAARRAGFESVNLDLIYGLPLQTEASFDRTLQQVLALRPERVAVYAYAHLPERFKPQRRIDAAELPAPQAKIAMLARAIEVFTVQGGYEAVGMDHFALPTDDLAVARRQGRLQRNFQGYSTQAECDSIGLGVSAIGRVDNVYSQNAKTLPEYYEALDRGEFPVARGLAMSRDDLLRRAVIMAIMCQGEVRWSLIEATFCVDVPSYFSDELHDMEPLVAHGLAVLGDEGLRVTPLGWHFVRAVAMVFDKHLRQAALEPLPYSRIV